jgi:hypothetical protein
MESRYFSRKTIYILKEYFYSPALKKLIKKSSFFKALRISSLADLSISVLAPSFKTLAIAFKAFFIVLKDVYAIKVHIF